jgi:glycine cleavage system H protein
MKSNINIVKDLYFTNDHEWVDFQGATAFTGICAFKLLGFKEVQEVKYHDSDGFMSKGEVIATIRYNDYQIEAHMPVNGKILQINDELKSGNQNLLLLQPESNGWIARIAPSQPYERKGLMLHKEYQLNGKDKYAK